MAKNTRVLLLSMLSHCAFGLSVQRSQGEGARAAARRAAPAIGNPGARGPAPSGIRVSDVGLTADVQIAQMPFQRNWASLPEPPKQFFLEVGANSRNVLQDEVNLTADDAFLITFEPLMDKYAYLLSRFGGQADSITQLGLQHERALALPLAVGCEGTAEFHLANIDGCSSLLKQNEQENRAGNWSDWLKNCGQQTEIRQVPCVSLETVIGDWLNGTDVAYAKIDAQGADLQVVKSAGNHVDKLKKVHMEVQCDRATKLYEGAPDCTGVYTEMLRLGFETSFDPSECQICRETDIDFHRN